MNIQQIRQNYPITHNDIYLNHAATSPIATDSIKQMQSLAAKMQRPLSEHFYPWLGMLEETRRYFAELIHAHPSEIAFCQNTSTGLSLIANAIPFQPGDRILVPRNEFPSNIYIWQSLQKKGIIFEFFDVEPGIPVIETLKKINLTQVRLISISAVSYATGRQYELKDIANFCRERNILICYDAIQALGTIPFDVSDIQPDFIASGAQKWLLGSVGVGFIYARKEWLDQLTVPLVGWTSVKYAENFSLKQLDFATDMSRFEPGLPNILPIAALNQSLKNLAQIGWETIYAGIKTHTDYLSRALSDANITTLAQQDQRAGITSFIIPAYLDINVLQKEFAKRKIHITERDNYIRVSPHFYNTSNELDEFLNIITNKTHKIYPAAATTTKAAPTNTNKRILLSGATGMLGKAFAEELAQQGYALTLIANDALKLNVLQKDLSEKFSSVDVRIEQADYNNPTHVLALLQRLKNNQDRYFALINCAGIAEADEFIHLSVEKLQAMLQINCVAAFQLAQLFITTIKAERALGILNIVSSTGRCGFPLLSGYAASNAALWSLSEVLARELSNDNLIATTYVAPPMHSRMQKKLGRIALRYFKLSGDFPYYQAKVVAQEAWEVFTKKKTLHINRYNRWTLWLNALIPELINKRIKKIWKR